MTRFALAVTLSLVVPAAAQLDSVAAVAAVLRETAPRPAPEALEGLRRRAAQGDAAAAEVGAALGDQAKGAALRARLAPADADGALVAELRRLASAAGAEQRERRVAAAMGSALRALEPVEEEDDAAGVSVSVFGGATTAGGNSAPVGGAAFGFSRGRGPWSFELEGDLQGSPRGQRVWGLEGGVSRSLGDTPLSLFVEGEHKRDDFLGIRGHESVKAGVGVQALQTENHSLEFGAGYGLAQERHAGGESEKHPAAVLAAEYAWRAASRLSFTQSIEYEFDPRAREDNELKSVTALVYDLSKRAALRVAYELRRRGEPVEGFPGSRGQATAGVVFNF